jgi:hypothetical protein
MSPDSIEARFAALRAEVTSWETQLKTLGPLVGQYQVLDDRIIRTSRDVDQLRSDMNARLHELHDEQERDMRREVENLHARISRIADRRDVQIKEIDKRIGDVSLTLKADIDECRGEAIALLGDRTSKRGQNLILIGTIVTGLLVILNGILIQSM